MHDYSDFLDIPVYISPLTTSGRLYKTHIDNAPLCILTSEDEMEYIEFLAKIIKAINYDIEKDCNIRVFDENDIIGLKDIVNMDSPEYILVFGLELKRFDVQAVLKAYDWNRFENFSLLHSYGLRSLFNNQRYKKLLWSQLKTGFDGK